MHCKSQTTSGPPSLALSSIMGKRFEETTDDNKILGEFTPEFWFLTCCYFFDMILFFDTMLFFYPISVIPVPLFVEDREKSNYRRCLYLAIKGLYKNYFCMQRPLNQ